MQEITVSLSGLAEDAVPLTMVQIPAGSFLMGSPDTDVGVYSDEKPQHEVTVEHDFYIGKYPVTQAQWVAVMGENPSCFNGKNHPVERVSWDECQVFIGKLNELGLGTFRLPSEAEWEYACRAGSTTNYCFGGAVALLGDYAFYRENSGGLTHPVGQKKPNAWGLYDMHGNVQEWCRDVRHKDYDGAPIDGSAWVKGGASCRVFRGGAWTSAVWNCRSAHRSSTEPDSCCGNLGFRLVMEVPSKRCEKVSTDILGLSVREFCKRVAEFEKQWNQIVRNSPKPEPAKPHIMEVNVIEIPMWPVLWFAWSKNGICSDYGKKARKPRCFSAGSISGDRVNSLEAEIEKLHKEKPLVANIELTLTLDSVKEEITAGCQKIHEM